PLLIGGATTSRLHTAVKIEPEYDHGVIHVLDASRAVTVSNDILNEEHGHTYLKSISEEYEQMREHYAGRSQQKKLLSFDEACNNSWTTNWNEFNPIKPNFEGVKEVVIEDLAELVPFIDWSPFFKTWMLTGKYPQILEDETVGIQASELFKDAQLMLERMKKECTGTAKGVFGIFPVARSSEQVIIYPAGTLHSDFSKVESLAEFHFLRQQAEKREGQPNISLADFICPESYGKTDYMGAFAVTAGLNISPLLDEFEQGQDDYSSILLKALADRLAEAFAEYLHYKVRTSYWGYSDESFDNERFIREDYEGIRPAPGYPACPDHTEKWTLFSLLGVPERIGVHLIESLAMLPASSVSGFYFAHPEARYFAVGKLGEDQLRAYSTRKNQSLKETEQWLRSNLAYEPES
ncbi:MAG: vitamin B12 dependent-methionine synthase activation domain-containing protein, partial [Bacteroidota bacterium]